MAEAAAPLHPHQGTAAHLRVPARIYELCQAGGLVFVRRTNRKKTELEVAETEWLLTARAQELWQKILTGRSV